MHVDLQRIELGHAGLAFGKDYLSGADALSQRILARLQSEDGIRVAAHLPAGTSLSRALRFQEGGVLNAARQSVLVHGAAETPDTDELIVRMGRRFLEETPSGMLVFWNYMHRAGDRAVKRSRQRWFHHGDDVYYVVTFDVATPTRITAAMRRAMSLPQFLVGFMAAPHAVLPPVGGAGSASLIASLAAACRVLYLLAYDGEAYVSIDFASRQT